MTAEKAILVGILLAQILVFWLLRQLPDLITDAIERGIKRAFKERP